MSKQDLLRAQLADLSPDRVEAALAWLERRAPFPRPTSVHLDLTLRCTARCLHCEQWSWPRHPELGLADLERLVCLFQAWGVETVTLAGGNPLLHPELPSVLRLARGAGLAIGVVTEGARLSAELMQGLVECASWVRFSLDGPTEAVHDQIRRRPGLFATVIGSVEELRAASTDLTIGLNTVIQRGNIEAIPAMVSLARASGVDTLSFKVVHTEDPLSPLLPTSGQWRSFLSWLEQEAECGDAEPRTNVASLLDLIQNVFSTHDLLSGSPTRGVYVREQVRCFAPLFFMCCDSVGNVYPCDYLQADTRPWIDEKRRAQYCAGNLLEDADTVLESLARLLREKVHMFPASGQAECGSCTRFCELNRSLTLLLDGEALSVWRRQAGPSRRRPPVFL